MQIYKKYFNSYTKALNILEIGNAKNKNGVQHTLYASLPQIKLK